MGGPAPPAAAAATPEQHPGTESVPAGAGEQQQQHAAPSTAGPAPRQQAHPCPEPGRQGLQRSSSSSSIAARPGLPHLAAAGALLLAGAAWLLRSVRRRRQVHSSGSRRRQHASAVQVEPEPTLPMFASTISLQPPPSSSPRPPLAGLRCVVAEHVALQGAVIGCGVPAVLQQCAVASESAAVVRRLLNLGLAVVGQGSTQPCNYPTLGDNIRNPVARFRAAGGGCSGAAAAVAAGAADVAVGSDALGSLRLPAAAMGLCAFVSTPGTLGSVAGPHTPRSPAPVCGPELEAVGLLAAELPQLCRVAACLGLPGAASLRHEVTQVVVAEDLFQLCEPELAPGIVAVKRAVLAWAGQEQAGSVQLMPFLSSNTSAWKELTTGSQAHGQAAAAAQALPPVLRELSCAAHLLYHADLAAAYGGLAADVELLDPTVAAALQQGVSADEQQLAVAAAVAREVQDVLKAAVKKDVVVVLPCVPAAAPRLDAPAPSSAWWRERSAAFAAVTSLGGCPSVVLPVGHLPDGAPLALALFGQARTDLRLLAVAEKLLPHIQAELAKLQQQAAAASEAAHATQGQQTQPRQRSGSARAGPGTTAKQPQLERRRIERAERAKLRGNECFKAGRFSDAIKAYSEALKLDPGNPVYANNRAMAYLKVFSFEAAEADCNRALAAAQLAVANRVKALLRRGTARMHKGDVHGARSDFRGVLQAEPNNRQAREELKALQLQEQDLDAARSSQALASVDGALLPGLADADAARLFESGQLSSGVPGAALGSYACGAAGRTASLDGLDAEQLARVAAGGGMPVVLGADGRPVWGPSGEPVVVGPGGQALMIKPSGEVAPYATTAR